MKTFTLMNEPMYYQLTIHRLNYEAYAGEGSFNKHINIMATPSNNMEFMHKRYSLISSIIAHYGIDTIREFLVDIKAA